MAAEVLQAIQDSDNGLPLKVDPSFAGESLSCEWAYVVDSDKRTFEVYEGFNKEPLDPSERFASAPVDVGATSMEGGRYHPVKHAKTWPLDGLPTNEEFLTAFKAEDDDETEAA